MKANELMIGDWVLDKAVSDKPVQIEQINEQNVHYKRGNGYMSAGVELLEPVPLTAEILEQNGFVTKDKPDNWTGYRSYKYSEGSTGIVFRLYHDTGKYKWSGKCEISLNALPYWIRFEYLHELQHILKSCGIDKEIKIKLED